MSAIAAKPFIEVTIMTHLLHGGILAATDDPWAETLFGLDPEKRFVLLIIAIGCGTGIILGTFAIASNVISAIHRRRAEEGFKRELLDRGLSTEEIVAMIESASPPEDAVGRWVATWCKKK